MMKLVPKCIFEVFFVKLYPVDVITWCEENTVPFRYKTVVSTDGPKTHFRWSVVQN